MLKPLDDISPTLAGLADGVHRQTIGQIDRLSGGVKRTAEGLHVTGEENFHNVGDENTAVYEFASSTFEKILTYEIDVMDNPITQIVMAVVSQYTTALPEWVIEEMLKQGALKMPDKVDTIWLAKATAAGIVDNIGQEHIAEATSLLNEPAQRLVGKQIGKKIAAALALALASAITKKIMTQSVELPILKRRLARIRKIGRKMKNGLGGAMLTLLNAQGILDKAAESSRQLQQSCPTLWNTLRYRLDGANMVYFLVESMTQEYIDRLALLEQNPKEFAKVMEALIKDKKTRQIFFPGTLH